MIKVYENSKIYIACPAGAATGGPELLHQLTYNLRKHFNINAVIFYYPPDHDSPIHKEYERYENPYVKQIEDNNSNILIVPEIVSGMLLLNNYKEIRKIIWWLSIDNFYYSLLLRSKKNFFFYRLINKFSYLIIKKPLFDLSHIAQSHIESLKGSLILTKNPLVKQADFHLVQSFYAKNYLLNAGIGFQSVFYLSDYLNEDFLKAEIDLAKKKNIVAYNPQKGLFFTKKIIKSSSNIKFIPLINMSRKEVMEILQTAKVYIDFGHHPGKDRLPREAAILGCCVITGKRGSARFFEDVPIQDEYKFEDKEENIPKIIEKIKDCFENFEERYKDFDYYRKIIKQEPQKFVEDLKKIFKYETT